MKRFICFLFVLLSFPSSSLQDKYYVCVVFQDNTCYEEFMDLSSLKSIISDFYSDSSLESVFVTRDISYVPKSNSY